MAVHDTFMSDASPWATEDREHGNSEAKSEPTCYNKVDLSHIQDDSVKTEILDILRKHVPMWNENSTIIVKEHRIDLEPGTRPVRLLQYRQRPTMREQVKTSINYMFAARLFASATSKLASAVVLDQKKNIRVRFCVKCHRLSSNALTNTYLLPQID